VGAVLGALTLTLAASFLSLSPGWQIGAQGVILILILILILAARLLVRRRAAVIGQPWFWAVAAAALTYAVAVGLTGSQEAVALAQSVQSRHRVARLLVEELGCGLPFRPEELSGCEALEGLEPAGVIVGIEEEAEVSA
jgi:hypothetical protein